MTLQDKLNIIENQFGLIVEEIEPSVYKVINTNQEVNIDKLQWALEECMLITSDKIRTEKLSTGIYTAIKHVYVIITVYDKELAWKYDDELAKEYTITMISDFKHKEGSDIRVDTLYSPEEI